MNQGEKQSAPVPPDAKVVIAGGSGVFGTTLADALEDLPGSGA